MIVCSLCHRRYDDSVVSCAEAGHPPLSETRSGSPEMIAGYRLEYLLESGVKGDVYRARQTDCGQSCLIRILSVDEQDSQLFLDEAKLAVAVFHPNVVDIYEAGSLESGEVFVVAEDPDGESLRELLNNVGVPHLLTSIQVVRQAAEALHAIHLKGLTHRAVAPENIILTTDAEHRLLIRIKDLDLGGVIERSIVSNKFFIDSAINSLKYFAPEQCSGAVVGMKTDVYSLGIVLYEMLAGAPPFDAEKAAELIEKHKNQRPPDIRINNFDLRMLLTHTLMESLSKQPEKRQSSANGFARQLRHIEQLATHVSTPPPAGVVAPTPPPKTLAAAPTPSPVIPAAAAIEPRKVIYEEYKLPLTPAIEHEPVIRNPGVMPASATSTARKDESEPIAVVDMMTSADDLSEIPYLISEEPVIETVVEMAKIAPAPPRRSRLKLHRKELRSKTAPPPPNTPENVPLPIAEPTAIKLIEVQDLPVEVPAPSMPAKIEWEQPDDDIPSVANVREVLAKEQLTEIPIVQMEAEEAVTVPSPAKQETPAVQAVPQKIAAVPALNKPEIPVVYPEPEEITLVRATPARRIRIDWDRPAAPQRRQHAQRSFSRTPDEVTFFPTILGASGKPNPTIDPDAGPFLSAYYASPRTRSSVPYRSLAIGGGFIALMALVLFGNDSIRTYVQAWGTGDSLAVKTSSTKESPPQAVPTGAVSPSRKKAIKKFREPMPEDNDEEADRSTSSPAKQRSLLDTKISRTSGVKPAAPKTPIVTRTEKAKIKPKAEPKKESGDKKSRPGSTKTAEPSRPRIVEVLAPPA